MFFEKKLLKFIKNFQLTDLIGFGKILEVKEKENFVDYVSDIVVAYSNKSLKDRIILLKLAKDISENNRDFDKTKKKQDNTAEKDNKKDI